MYIFKMTENLSSGLTLTRLTWNLKIKALFWYLRLFLAI
jgi:hypothetical protein